MQPPSTVPEHALVDTAQCVHEHTLLYAEILYMQIKISAVLFTSLNTHLIYMLILLSS